ncbi:MAG TPA: hypothetical protein GX532_06640 [Clostridia bacterium]|nr:hypothetical protein [Clostridia bacterium]
MFIKVGKMSIPEIREKVKNISQEAWPEIIEALQLDTRKGVQNIALRMENKLVVVEKERFRLKQLQEKEAGLRKKGYKLIGGVDSV